MSLIKCPECKKKVSEHCENCPNCGYPINKIIKSKNDNATVSIKAEPVIKKERKPINKKTVIGIIAACVVILGITGIVGYNAFLPRINATKNFNAAVVNVKEKNVKLDEEIKNSEDLILKKQPLLDENLISVLESAVSDAKAVKETNFKAPHKIDEIIARTKELNSVDYTSILEDLGNKHNAVVISIKRYQLVNHPTEAYIIQCLKNIPEIVNVSAVTEDNDPNGNLNKPGGYTSTVYFADSRISLDKSLHGKTLIAQGTEAGGSIEVYISVEDAIKRRDYLASYDGSILANGSHTVIGTVLIRTSDELTASQQKDLEAKIIASLTYLSDVDKDNSKQANREDKTSTTSSTETPTENVTVSKKKENNVPRATQPVNRKQEAVVEAIKQANRWFPTDRHFIEHILVNPSLEEGFDAFTEDEAAYAIKNANIDWKKHALYNAKEIIDTNPDIDYSKSEISSDVESGSSAPCGCAGFTKEELKYAVDNCGID